MECGLDINQATLMLIQTYFLLPKTVLVGMLFLLMGIVGVHLKKKGFWTIKWVEHKLSIYFLLIKGYKAT